MIQDRKSERRARVRRSDEEAFFWAMTASGELYFRNNLLARISLYVPFRLNPQTVVKKTKKIGLNSFNLLNVLACGNIKRTG